MSASESGASACWRHQLAAASCSCCCCCCEMTPAGSSLWWLPLLYASCRAIRLFSWLTATLAVWCCVRGWQLPAASNKLVGIYSMQCHSVSSDRHSSVVVLSSCKQPSTVRPSEAALVARSGRPEQTITGMFELTVTATLIGYYCSSLSMNLSLHRRPVVEEPAYLYPRVSVP
jgi:hypothetical protein